MSTITDRLKVARAVALADLVPAFDLAIIQAEQAEYEADRASTIAMTGIEAAYPPLVLKLAEATPEPPKSDPWAGLVAPEAPKAPWESQQ